MALEHESYCKGIIFLNIKMYIRNYIYDEIDELGHEWRFWDIELCKFLDYAGLKEVRPAKSLGELIIILKDIIKSVII